MSLVDQDLSQEEQEEKARLIAQVRRSFRAPRGRCYYIFFKFRRKNGALTPNTAKLCKNWMIELALNKNANFFLRKLAIIAESSDHNIDRRGQLYESVLINWQN
jgi:hypothetical protein